MEHLGIKSVLAAAIAAISFNASATAITTNVIAVVDESGSMSGEHAWLGSMMVDLNAALATAAGADPFAAEYGLVGFGGGGTHLGGHQHDVGGAGSQYGTATQFATATGSLQISGGTEDGYAGITTALGYAKPADSVRNLILVTDEDRDSVGGGETYASMSSSLLSDMALLNAVLDINVRCGDNSVALGVDSNGNGYRANGSGGFTTCSGAHVVSGFGTTVTDYVNLAFATGGAAWDLNQLRLGGLTATSFTSAFIDVKVKETISQPGTSVPEPAPLALLAAGIAGLGVMRRRKA